MMQLNLAASRDGLIEGERPSALPSNTSRPLTLAVLLPQRNRRGADAGADQGCSLSLSKGTRVTLSLRMPLHPQAQALLGILAAQRSKPRNEMTPEEARFVFRDFAALAGPPEEVASFCDLEVPGPIGAIPARLYRASLDPAAPVLVFFHGGGWVIGDLDIYDGLCRSLARAAGCAVFSVGYRLAPENKFPAAVEDCQAATVG